MNKKQNKSEDSKNFKIDNRFGDDLKSLFGPGRGVPGDVDRAVMAAARKRLSSGHRRLRIARWAVSAAAAAAVVMFAFVYNFNQNSDKPIAASKLAIVKEDIDGNGRVDILDAFVLSRRVESAEGADRELDINGDGVVDSKDVDAVAARAVRINKGV